MGKSGVAIPTALFFVLLVFFLATLLAARAHFNLSVSRYEADGGALLYAARGAAAETLRKLNLDDEWKDHGRSNKATFSTSPLVTQGWVENDPEHPLIRHVYGAAHPPGRPDLAQVTSRVVLRRPDTEGLVFTNVPIVEQYTPDSLFYKRSYDSDWTLVPPMQRMTYTDNGQLQVQSGYCGSLTNLEVDEQGRLYAHYVPGFDRDDGIGAIYRQKYADFLRSGDFGGMFDAVPDYVEELGDGLRQMAFGNSVVARYDTATENWEALPFVPDVTYSGGRPQVQPNRLYNGGVGAIEVTEKQMFVSLYKDGQDALLELDLQSETWTAVEPPPREYYRPDGSLVRGMGVMPEVCQAEASADGTLYATWANEERTGAGVFRREAGGNWELTPPPEKGQFDDAGNWRPVSGSYATDLWHLEVTPKGEAYLTWNASLENPSLSYVVYKLDRDTSGQLGWEPLPPTPHVSYDAAGKVEELPGIPGLVKSMAIDAEDQRVVSIYEKNRPDPLVQYSEGEFVPMQPLPDKRHDRNGNLVEQDGEFLFTPFQAEGGGFKNGLQQRYIPVFKY